MKLINWKTKEIIYEANVTTMKELVEEANNKGISLRYADLSYVNLKYADFRYANLSNANLRYADLSCIDLRYTNLSYADLSNANLTNANLSNTNIIYTIGNGKEIRTIINKYHITYTKDQLAIGCKQYSINEWKSFKDKDILKMYDRKGLEWWKEWKDWLFMTIDKSFK